MRTVNALEVQVPHIGTLGTRHSVVGSVPALLDVGSEEDHDAHAVIDDELGILQTLSREDESAVGLGVPDKAVKETTLLLSAKARTETQYRVLGSRPDRWAWVACHHLMEGTALGSPININFPF